MGSAHLRAGDQVLLIVENDLAFARFLLDTCRERGFKGIVTSQGAAALLLATQFKPSAITLDLFLPDIDGWHVLPALHQLRARLFAEHEARRLVWRIDAEARRAPRALKAELAAIVEVARSGHALDLHDWLDALDLLRAQRSGLLLQPAR